jgi:hypothetical protein
MKHIDPDQLILYHYGELDGGASGQAGDRAAIEAHLAVCGACRSELSAMERTLAAVSSLPVPERAESYGRQVWQRLEPRLKPPVPLSRSRERSGWLDVFAWQRWAVGGAVAALVVIAFVAGRFWPRPEAPAPVSASISAEARDRVLLSAVADHMERSEILLMELENAGESGGKEVDISLQREQAQELAAGSRLYEVAAEQDGETGLASLLGDLGRVMVVVGHSPSRVSPAELAELRRRIEGPGILFKLQVVDSGIEQRLKPAPGRQSSGNVQD